MIRQSILFLFLTATLLLTPQEGKQGEDLKVGLVLSGGGAKGLAHIGALKVIEEAGVKIDYIAGTSMGAIVGGLYASGYTAQQLDSIFRNTDFVTLIEDNLPRGAKSFYEKEASEKYALTLPFNNFKVSFPPAYSGGQNIYNELVRVLYHVKDVSDFSKLSIPFLCIATDVETGEEVILDRGYLPEAIMASGTLPSLFEPATMGDRVLIDGGVVNNYPVEEVKKMGADIIIGVDVQHGLRDREALLSATEILLQINNYRTALDMVEKSKLTDIYIKPEMGDYSVIDFNAATKIVESGEVAARQNYNALERISEQQRHDRALIKYVDVKDTIIVKQLILKGNENYTRGYVKGKLRFELDKKITFEKLQQGISNLSATDNFKTIRYELLSNDDGVDLILDLNENPNNTYIRIGAHYDDLYKTAALLNVTYKKLLTKDDVASLDFVIGDNLRYDFQYFVDKGAYWSFGINSRFNAFKQDIDFDLIKTNFDVQNDVGVNNIRLDVTDITNQLYLQTSLKEELAFRIGAEHKFIKYGTNTFGESFGNEVASSLSLSSNRTTFERSSFYSTFGQLILDSYDDKYFPSRGLYFNGDFHFYLFSSDYNDNFKEYSIAKARMGGAFPLMKNVSLNLETEGGFKLGTSGVTTFDFVLGGYGTDLTNNFVPFYGYDFLSLPGNSYVKAYGRLDIEFAAKNHLLFAANFANVDDDIFRTAEWFTLPDYSGYGIGYGWESFLGPVQVIYSWSPEVSEGNFFFSIGYWF
ncbi:patatin-like phospholipase family protein [Maribacter algicola]|uniref:Patatin-like phospholipase family protein n=1 Tax=Meishania litoralis TaxID=3434685 RepID=A0ACC7LJS5_9FLAO